MTIGVEVDGDDYHVFDDTQIPNGITWAEAYKGMVMLRDELQRQINERKNCPFNPLNVRRDGEPTFEETNGP